MNFDSLSANSKPPIDGAGAQPEPEVLVVDDEPAVRRLLGAALGPHGLRVCTAASAEEAVRLYEQRRDRIGVVLLDVRMTGLDGPAALLALQKLNPNIRCCFMSGSTGKYTEADLLALGASRVFAKPFHNLEDLARTLRKLAEPLERPK